MPWGVEEALQNSTSNLVDAYKRSELDRLSKLGIFALVLSSSTELNQVKH